MPTAHAMLPILSRQLPVLDRGKQLLKTATGYWDVEEYVAGSQVVPNRGTGGTALDAQLGSTTSVDSNDPQHLPWSASTGSYVYLPGVVSNYLSVPDAANLRITGDLEIVVRVALDDWTPSAIVYFAGRYDTSANRSYVLRVGTSGVPELVLSTDGTATSAAAASVAVPFADGTTGWVKVTRRQSDGRVQFFTASDSTSEPTFTQLGTDQTATTSAINAGTGTFTIGALASGGTVGALKIHRAIVRDGIGGTTVLDVDTSVITSGAATSFAAKTGQTVTINRSTSGRKAVAVVRPVMLFGTDDYLTVADNDLLDFVAGESFSLLWFGRIWGTATAATQIIGKQAGISGAVNPGYLLIANAGGAFQLRIKDGTNNVTTTAATYTSGASSFYAGILNGATGTTWLNGVAAASTSTAIVTGSLANAFTMDIGRDSAVYGDFEWHAAAVFRRALSAAEISLLSAYATARMP